MECLWAEHARNDPLMPIPPIDFSKDMVLGVFLGTRGNTCFSVTIESVEQVAQQRLIVRYREVKVGRFVVSGDPASAFNLLKLFIAPC